MSLAEHEALIESGRVMPRTWRIWPPRRNASASWASTAARRDHLTVELVARMLAGEHPVRLWREQRGLTLSDLAARAGIALSYLSEIESGRKPGNSRAFQKLATALGLGGNDLAP